MSTVKQYKYNVYIPQLFWHNDLRYYPYFDIGGCTEISITTTSCYLSLLRQKSTLANYLLKHFPDNISIRMRFEDFSKVLYLQNIDINYAQSIYAEVLTMNADIINHHYI